MKITIENDIVLCDDMPCPNWDCDIACGNCPIRTLYLKKFEHDFGCKPEELEEAYGF